MMVNFIAVLTFINLSVIVHRLILPLNELLLKEQFNRLEICQISLMKVEQDLGYNFKY